MEKINIDSRYMAFLTGMYKLDKKICFDNGIYKIDVSSGSGYMADFNTVYNIYKKDVLIFSGTCDDLHTSIIEGLNVPQYVKNKIFTIDKNMILNAC